MEAINSTKIYNNHVLDYSISLDLSQIRKQCGYISLQDVSQYLTMSTVSAEDKKFWTHSGIDWERLLKATYINMKAREKLQGASTISQQYVKNVFLVPERTISRKLKEMYLAMTLERLFTKEEILEFYLNIIDYGNENYGIGNASEFYFEKPASDLLLEEATFLAGLPNNPYVNDPFTHFEYAKYRQTMVIHSLVRNRIINKKQAYELMSRKLNICNRGASKKPVRNIELLFALQNLFFERLSEQKQDSPITKEVDEISSQRTLDLYK